MRRPGSRNFTRGLLIVTPGLTIRDRLRVLQPNDPDNYYEHRDLVPRDLLGARALLKVRTGEELKTRETEGHMIQRMMPELMGMRRIMVLNDEAHHCYREKP